MYLLRTGNAIVISDKSDTLYTDETLRNSGIDILNINWNDYLVPD
jgi:hypothetical protein